MINADAIISVPRLANDHCVRHTRPTTARATTQQD
jgi:hypothetical protein